MAIGQLLRTLPLRRHTVVGALVLATVLYLVYQFTFVAELSESSKPKQHRPNFQKRHARKDDARKQNVPYRQRFHPKDISLNRDGEEEQQPSAYKEAQIKPPAVKESSKNTNSSDSNQLENPKDTNAAVLHANSSATFKCEASGKVIPSDKVNDDYCDCPEDGSDEPRTNACVNGKFLCLKHVKNFPKSVPSGWVNDGVCDCCDGSDEWKKKKVDTILPLELQKKVGRYISPCPNRCPH